jgi:hypothetical protein
MVWWESDIFWMAGELTLETAKTTVASCSTDRAA